MSNKSKDLPIVTALSVIKVPESKDYVCVKIQIQGDKVINMESGVPNLKKIVLDEFKIQAVKEFIDKEI